jgi:hypothetical protein
MNIHIEQVPSKRKSNKARSRKYFYDNSFGAVDPRVIDLEQEAKRVIEAAQAISAKIIATPDDFVRIRLLNGRLSRPVNKYDAFLELVGEYEQPFFKSVQSFAPDWRGIVPPHIMKIWAEVSHAIEPLARRLLKERRLNQYVNIE